MNIYNKYVHILNIISLEIIEHIVFCQYFYSEMIKKIFLLLIILLFLPGLTEGYQNVLVLQSMKIKPYEDALRGFKKSCPCSIKTLIVSELNGLNIKDRIREIKPDIILTIGKEALSRVKGITHIPVVYLMVLNPESIISSGQKNFTGVSMRVSAEKQLAIFQKIMPGVKTIGLLFDSEKTGPFIKKARRVAEKRGLELITGQVTHPAQVPSVIAIKNMKSNIDAFWMLPDTSVICSETVEFLLLFSLENKIPILSFSDKYVEMGAFMSLNIDAARLGEQAARMTNKILSGKDVRAVSAVRAGEIQLSINLKAADNLGIKFSHKIAHSLNIPHNDDYVVHTYMDDKIVHKTRMVY